MSNKKAEILSFIEQKKIRGSLRKPRYTTRKLSIGLVSCMLGFTLLVSPSEAKASEPTPVGAEETLNDPDGDQEDEQEEKLVKQEENKELKNKDNKETDEIESLKAARDTAKAEIEKVFENDTVSEKSLYDYNKSIDEAESQEAIQNIVDEVKNLKSEKETDEVEKNKSSVETNQTQDTKTDTEEGADKNNGTQDNDEMEVSGQLNDTAQGQGATHEENEPQPTDGVGFDQTTIKVGVNKVGLGEKGFDFDNIFTKKDAKVQLINKETGIVVGEASIDKNTKEIVFTGAYEQADIESDKYELKFLSESKDGYKTDKFALNYDGKTKTAQASLNLYQVRNNKVIVKTKEEDTEEIVYNPSTKETGGKLKLVPNKGKLERNREKDIPTDSNPTRVGRNPDSKNKDVYDNGFTIKVTGTEKDVLVDTKANKVYEPNIATPDENGIKPTEIEFRRRSLVENDKDYRPKDDNYVTVEFVVKSEDKDKGTIKESKRIFRVRKGVNLGNNLKAPDVTVNEEDGWKFPGWDRLDEIYNENKTYTAKFSREIGTIEDIAKTTKKTTETIPGKVKYEADDSLDFEEKVVDKAPVDGEKEVTTVSEPGKDDVVTEEVTKEPEDGTTRVGNKKVETTQNEDGSTTETTTIYDVDPDTGELTNPTTTTKTTTDAKPIEDIAKTTKVTKETIPGKVKYEADDSLDFGEKKVETSPEDGEKEITTVSQKGQDDVVTEKTIKEAKDGLTKVGNKEVETTQNEDGSTTTTTKTYEVDPDTGELSNPKTTTKTTTDAKPIEDIAKTTKVTKETIPGKVKYEADDSLDFGEKKVETSPEDGEKEITTVSQKGQDDVVTEKTIKEAKDGLTKVGNKEVETTQNEDGSTTTTTKTYEVDPETGELSNPQTTTKTTTDAKPIEDIAKTTKVTKETIPAEVKYEADDSLDFEEKVVDKAPVDGEKEVTTVSEPGKDDVVTEKETKAPEDGLTKVGNKQVETTTNDDGSTTEKTTIYEVDPDTGELKNPTTTTKTTPAQEYQVIFNANGGTPTTQKITVKDGEVVTGVTEPTREGYKFVKWVKLGTDNAFDLSTPFNKDLLDEDNAVIFTAVWEKNVSENGGSAIFYPKETHPIFKKVGDKLTEEEITNAIVVLGLDKSKYTVTINEDQVVPTTDKPGDYIIDVTINFEDGTTDDAQVIIIITDKKGTTAEEIDPTIPGKTDVVDKDNLTDKEKEEVKNKVEEANKDKFPEGTEVSVDDKGNATITYPDGSKDTIPADKLVNEKSTGDNPGGTIVPTDPTDPTKPGDDNKPGDDSKPSEEDDKPSDEDSKPSEEDDKPSEDDSKPSEEDDKSSDNDSKPSDEDSKPSEEDDKPSEDDSKPSDEDNNPSEDDKQSSDDSEQGTNDASKVSRGQAGSTNPAKRPREVSSDASKNAGKNVKTGIAGKADTLATLAMAATAFLASKKKKEEEDN